MNKLISWFIMDVSFQKDASLHEEVSMKRCVALKDMMVHVKASLYNGWELKQNKCDSWNNMWRSIREKESNEV